MFSTFIFTLISTYVFTVLSPMLAVIGITTITKYIF